MVDSEQSAAAIAEIAERYGDDSPEAQVARVISGDSLNSREVVQAVRDRFGTGPGDTERALGSLREDELIELQPGQTVRFTDTPVPAA